MQIHWKMKKVITYITDGLIFLNDNLDELDEESIKNKQQNKF